MYLECCYLPVMHVFSLFRLSLISVLLASSSVDAASGITSMTLQGVDKLDLKTATIDNFGQFTNALMHARNILVGMAKSADDLMPCSHEMFYGEMAGGQPAYQAVKRNLLSQGWKPVREVSGQTTPEVAFQLKKNSVTLLGLWADVPAKKRSALVMCEQAEIRKPMKPLPRSPALGKTVSFPVQDWHQGVQNVFAILAFTGKSGSAGQVSASGRAEVVLEIPKEDQLQPIGRWKTGFDVQNCEGGVDTFTVSDPKVRFTVVHKLMVGKLFDESDPHISSNFGNSTYNLALDTPLVYTSGPVRISGHRVCPDGQENLDVELSLPGGWTAVTHQSDFPRFGNLTEHLVNWASVWNWRLTIE